MSPAVQAATMATSEAPNWLVARLAAAVRGAILTDSVQGQAAALARHLFPHAAALRWGSSSSSSSTENEDTASSAQACRPGTCPALATARRCPPPLSACALNSLVCPQAEPADWRPTGASLRGLPAGLRPPGASAAAAVGLSLWSRGAAAGACLPHARGPVSCQPAAAAASAAHDCLLAASSLPPRLPCLHLHP